LAKPGQPNQLLCFVHDTSVTALEKSARADEPKGCSSGPNHYLISDLWGQRFGGIWQDVSLRVEPAVNVEDVFVPPYGRGAPAGDITSYRKKAITVQTTLRNETTEPVTVSLAQDILGPDQKPVFSEKTGFSRPVVLSLPVQSVKLEPGEARQVSVSAEWPNPKLWGIGGEWGEPKHLYHLRSQVTLVVNPKSQIQNPKSPLDTHFQRFGFREFWIEDGQFWLNGKRLPLQGGGNWYLQEGKAPHGHRWFGLHMYRSERGMNVNIQRWHRHGDISREFFDLGDELGMLSEPEGAYWGVSGIPDLMGSTDWDDPVWAANLGEHYRQWARKHRNHPSIVLWSVENETFCQTQRPKAMVDRFVAFGRALNEEDPTRPVTFHGVENGGYCSLRDDIQIINLHYPGDPKVKDWRKQWGGRPCVNGEFQNYPVLFAMSGPEAAKSAEAVDQMCKHVAHWTAYYREIQLSGALHFLPYMVGLFTTADRSLMGPWGDLLPDPAKFQAVKEGWMKGSVHISATAPIPWPSLSGPGIKCERLLTGTGNRSLINWFDPQRPVITPNKTYDAFAGCWDKMPPLNPERAAEAIVTVTRAAKPLANAAVLARPLDGQSTHPMGVMSDPAGTAWFVFQEPGRYEITCGESKAVFEARRLSTNSRPGYADVPRVSLAGR
ncbi:MAG: hypothetical protein FJ272_04225, partial [Planctomycetes bacterium]|nr:hypothetical protein [Planctomycetota bacterium]